MTKKFIIGDFLTREEVALAVELRTAKKICAKIIRPNIERINKAIGQENDPMYIAYMIEYAVTRAEFIVKDTH